MLKKTILTYSEEAELRGREKKAFDIAKKLLKRGMPLSDIADIVDLPIDKIRAFDQS